jgi:hypothetical protein
VLSPHTVRTTSRQTPYRSRPTTSFNTSAAAMSPPEGEQKRDADMVVLKPDKIGDADFANYFCTYGYLYHQKDMLEDQNRMTAGAVQV